MGTTSSSIEPLLRLRRSLEEESESRAIAGPGWWLRATGILAVAATAADVVSGDLGLRLAHGALALIALAPLITLALAAWLAHPRLRRPAYAALAIMLIEIAIGGVVYWTGSAGWAATLHLTAAALALAGSAIVAASTFRGRAAASGRWRDYVTLTKPRIMSLLLITAAGGMFVAARGRPSLLGLAALLAGGALASGGASALNHVLDADIDQVMGRTGTRPVASHRVPPYLALEFGLALSAFSFVLFASLVNVLAAFLALAGNLFYVLVYTGWLKRSTPQNIVIGGAAGAFPPLVGWAAATGRLDLAAGFLFLIVFMWTPPHFWALALMIRRDYERAKIPMLPVVKGDRETARQILWYSVLLVVVTMLPYLWGPVGLAYLVPAAALGAVFLYLAWRLNRDVGRERAWKLYRYSLLYLAALFVALAVAPLLG